MVAILQTAPEKSNGEIFNELLHNQKTKSQFEALGLNYDKWVEYDPNSNISYRLDGQNVITAKKVDMNNIPHSIFLGEDTHCCTKITGGQAESAVTYISSKMIQAIEVLHNNIPVANVMCYIAKVNGVPSLILDNIETKPQYQKDEIVKIAIFSYAEKLAKDISETELTILLGYKRNDIDTNELNAGVYNISLVGDSGPEKIYLDFLTNRIDVNHSTRNQESVALYGVSKKVPKSQLKVNDMFNLQNCCINHYVDYESINDVNLYFDR